MTSKVDKNGPLYVLTIPGRPRVLKNGKRIFGGGRGRRKIVLPSSQYQKWEQNAKAALSRSFKGHLVDWPCRVFMRFYFENRQGEADVSNLLEGPADVMQRVGILKNDRLIMRIEGEKFFGAEPRTEIEIYRYEVSA